MGDGAKTESVRVDQAALLGTALVAVITVSTAPGAWDAFNTMTGITLLLVLFEYCEPVRSKVPDRSRGSTPLRTASFVCVAALCLCLTLAWPVQGLWGARYSSVCGGGPGCIAQHVDGHILIWVWLVMCPVLYGLTAWLNRRRERHQQGGGSSEDGAAPAIPQQQQNQSREEVREPP